MKTVLSIAGSDSSGGAGIQADIKTCCAMGVYAATAITALTAQNTLGVQGIGLVEPEFVKLQIKAVVEDIFPDAVKIGMIGSPEIAAAIAEAIKEFNLENVVLDPVLVASCGDSLSGDSSKTAEAIIHLLAPLAKVITPNIPEARTIVRLGGENFTEEDMDLLPERLLKLTRAENVLLKGGHASASVSVDRLAGGRDGEIIMEEFSSERIETPNNHGTGCTLSSAIACGLAKGKCLSQAVRDAKKFVTEALRAGRLHKIGKGTGPLDFFVGAE